MTEKLHLERMQQNQAVALSVWLICTTQGGVSTQAIADKLSWPRARVYRMLYDCIGPGVGIYNDDGMWRLCDGLPIEYS